MTSGKQRIQSGSGRHKIGEKGRKLQRDTSSVDGQSLQNTTASLPQYGGSILLVSRIQQHLSLSVEALSSRCPEYSNIPPSVWRLYLLDVQNTAISLPRYGGSIL
ncbi:hypothetical protein PoB_003108300 [Plakobranchus ocellatus]|uniref:Uncharacterized protein n=1 Tax=Plakobranchus ocellatus TaxID=259542 RepID=A0AAV4ACU0_9GAST|nr:hypothetical protein PoB_003108300 [Plakobranchus ocellatus]